MDDSCKPMLSVAHLKIATQDDVASKEKRRKERMSKKLEGSKLNFTKNSLPPITTEFEDDVLNGGVPENSLSITKGVMDGFYLVEAGHVEFPDELEILDLSGKRLRDSVPEDLEFFTQLKMIDLGENELTMEMISAFPSLEEIHLYCNNIREIPPSFPAGAFQTVRVLNLSYNLLTSESLAGISALTQLEQLDLTGNNLENLPKSMTDLTQLEVLNLSCNRMQSPSALHIMASMRGLRELNVSNNEFRSIPLASKDAFAKLEWINLANNKISDEADLKGLMPCTKLFCIVLYNNPLTVEAVCCRSEVTINDRVVTLVTDPPVSDALPSFSKSSRAFGRHAPHAGASGMYNGSYTSFRISKLLQRPSPTKRSKPISPLDRLRASRFHNTPLFKESKSRDSETCDSDTRSGRDAAASRPPQSSPSSKSGSASSPKPSFADVIRLKMNTIGSRGMVFKDPSRYRSAMSDMRTALQRPTSTSAEFQLKGHNFETSTVSWTKKRKAPVVKNFEATLKKSDSDFKLSIADAKKKSGGMLRQVKKSIQALVSSASSVGKRVEEDAAPTGT